MAFVASSVRCVRQRKNAMNAISACIGLSILAAGCASTGPSKENLIARASVSRSSETTGSVALNSKIISTARQQQEDGADYVIGAGDLLVISVLDLSEVEKVKVRVGAEGFIRLPLVDTVKANNLTARQLESKLANLFGADYLHDPQVSVFIEEYRSQRVAVLGEVNKPGIYEVSERRLLTDMLALAGGLTINADQMVYVIRKSAGATPDPSNSGELLKIDLEHLLSGRDPSLNVKVDAGDVVSVPKSGEFLLGGAVKKPGPYPLKGKLTVDQAIYFGEALKEDADLTDIEVLRINGSKNEVFKINLDQLKQDGTPGLAIQKNDVVFVGTSGPKAVMYGALDFFKTIIRFGVSAGAAL